MIPASWLLFALACGRPDGSAPASTDPAVAVRPIAAHAVSATVSLPGQLDPWQQVDLRARTSAFVDDRRVDVGSRVAEGDVLVRLSAPDTVAKRAEADAQLRSAQGRLDHLEQASKTEGVVAASDLETLRAEVDARQSQVDALSAVERELTVRAPFDGVVTARGADEGALVGPSGPVLVRLVDDDPLRLVVAVPERLAGNAIVGSAIDFTLAGSGGDARHATVARAAGEVDPMTRTVRVELDVPNPDGAIVAGRSADVAWPAGGAGDALFVPTSSIVRTSEGVFVLAVRGGKVERVVVRPGLADGKDTAVEGELQQGESVVVHGSEDLVSGTAVTTRVEGG